MPMPGDTPIPVSRFSLSLAEESLRGGQIEAGQRRSADGRHRAEFHDSGYPEPLHRADGLHTDGLADVKVFLARSRLVDYDLVLLRPCAVDERQWVEGRIAPGDAEPEIRGAAVDDRLAVVADQLSLAVDTAVRDADIRKGADLLQ